MDSEDDSPLRELDPIPQTLLWKPDWQACRENLDRWWRGDGLAVDLQVVREHPRVEVKPFHPPEQIEARWLDPAYRCRAAELIMVGLDYWAEAFPYFDTQIGPGSLGMLLGASPVFADTTVWYGPLISDPRACPGIRFEPDGNRWLDRHMALIDEGLGRANGRYLVGMPDLIEGLDTLAALRGDLSLLYDLTDRPGWVLERLAEINVAYLEAFNRFYERIKGAEGGNAFSAFRIWGPGRTAKLQCDISANLSPRMFARFVQPFLADQCERLDFSLYHLDGTTALQHLDLLLEIDRLDGIEWTPQAGQLGGGDAVWYDLYRRIRAHGKSLQAWGVKPEEVIPLLDAVGPDGMFILFDGPVDQRTAERLMIAIEPFRGSG